MAEKKKFKSSLVLIIFLTIGLCIIGFNLYREPSLLQNVPLLKNLVSSKTGSQTEVEKLRQDNDNLKKGLAQKEQELQILQKDMAALRQQIAASPEGQLKAEIEKLNKDLQDARSKASSQKASYKDMAKYFTAMKSKDAASILSRLDNKDIIGILGEMEAENAAEILQNIDHEKAAQISREMLVTAPTGG